MPEFDNNEFRETLTETFKRTALEIFLHKTARQYKSFCLGSLQEMFGLSKQQVNKQIGNLIMHNRLQMSIDYKNNLLIVDQASTDIKEL